MYNGYLVVKAVTALHSTCLQLGAEMLVCIMTTACLLVMVVAGDDGGHVVVAIARKGRAISNNNYKLLLWNDKMRTNRLNINFFVGCCSLTFQDSN